MLGQGKKDQCIESQKEVFLTLTVMTSLERHKQVICVGDHLPLWLQMCFQGAVMQMCYRPGHFLATDVVFGLKQCFS